MKINSNRNLFRFVFQKTIASRPSFLLTRPMHHDFNECNFPKWFEKLYNCIPNLLVDFVDYTKTLHLLVDALI